MNKKTTSTKEVGSTPILQKDNETEKEFGGAVGAACIMIFSHILPYYLWISNFFYDGRLIHPESL
jgi:hypothetical protein